MGNVALLGTHFEQFLSNGTHALALPRRSTASMEYTVVKVEPRCVTYIPKLKPEY
eukprot:SAG31_NODE_29127_length_400_cov_1.016611_1_plen_54_part_10